MGEAKVMVLFKIQGEVISAAQNTPLEALCGRNKGDEGVSAIVEYMMTFIIAFVLFMVMLLMFNNVFVNGPTESVCKVQFTDIGNDVAAKMLDTYLVAPSSGRLQTSFEIPATVAGKSYSVKISSVGENNDAEVDVYSSDSSIRRKITVNRIQSTISLVGTTTSLSYTHWVEYTSSVHP